METRNLSVQYTGRGRTAHAMKIGINDCSFSGLSVLWNEIAYARGGQTECAFRQS